MRTLPTLLIISSALAATHIQADQSKPNQPLSLYELEQKINALETRLNQPPLSHNIQISGLMELEAAHTQDYDSKDTQSSLTLATVELAAENQINAFSNVSMSFLYEEGDTDFELDTAAVDFQIAENASMSVGQYYLPFGSYSTHQVNDTLALDIAEIRNTAITASYELNHISAHLYVFSDDQGHLDQAGSRLSFSNDHLNLNLDYSNNILNRDTLKSIIKEAEENNKVISDKRLPAVSLSGAFHMENLALHVEHLALDTLTIDAENISITASQVEGAYTFNEATFAVTLQQTQDAIALALPEQRLSISGAYSLFDHLHLAAELWLDQDYSVAEGGTGKSSDNLVLHGAIEF